jgi:hypothetical protein
MATYDRLQLTRDIYGAYVSGDRVQSAPYEGWRRHDEYTPRGNQGCG